MSWKEKTSLHSEEHGVTIPTLLHVSMSHNAYMLIGPVCFALCVCVCVCVCVCTITQKVIRLGNWNTLKCMYIK